MPLIADWEILAAVYQGKALVSIALLRLRDNQKLALHSTPKQPAAW